jgi:hypothetical protein
MSDSVVHIEKAASGFSTPLATTAESTACVVNLVKYTDWSEGLSQVRKLLAANQGKEQSHWFQTDLITETDGSFVLRCSTCEQEFSSNNPSNFWRAHKKKCALAQQGHEYKRGMRLLFP